jgi:hypothetical protein
VPALPRGAVVLVFYARAHRRSSGRWSAPRPAARAQAPREATARRRSPRAKARAGRMQWQQPCGVGPVICTDYVLSFVFTHMLTHSHTAHPGRPSAPRPARPRPHQHARLFESRARVAHRGAAARSHGHPCCGCAWGRGGRDCNHGTNIAHHVSPRSCSTVPSSPKVDARAMALQS